MKKGGPVLLLFGIGGLILYYLYTGGQFSKGGASGGKLPTPPSPHGLWDTLTAKPWFYPALGALIIVVIASFLWRKIGTWGQRAVIIALTVTGVYIAAKQGWMHP